MSSGSVHEPEVKIEAKEPSSGPWGCLITGVAVFALYLVIMKKPIWTVPVLNLLFRPPSDIQLGAAYLSESKTKLIFGDNKATMWVQVDSEGHLPAVNLPLDRLKALRGETTVKDGWVELAQYGVEYRQNAVTINFKDCTPAPVCQEIGLHEGGQETLAVSAGGLRLEGPTRVEGLLEKQSVLTLE